jgi:hypothetical protein
MVASQSEITRGVHLETLGESTSVHHIPARRLAVKPSSWRETFLRIMMAGLVALFAAQWLAIPASANSHFMGVLKSSPPLSPPFITSPGSYDISAHPATVVFTTRVENLTNHVVTVTVDVGVHHILTYYGLNVADGQPGKPGITFKGSDAPNLTEEKYGTPYKMTFTVQPKGAAAQMVTFNTAMTTCGYFQFDIGKHEQGIHENLAAGYARVLGCKTSPPPPPPPPPPGTGGTGGVSGSGGVGAATAGLPLANTGLPVAGGLIGIFLSLIGALGLRIRRS